MFVNLVFIQVLFKQTNKALIDFNAILILILCRALILAIFVCLPFLFLMGVYDFLFWFVDTYKDNYLNSSLSILNTVIVLPLDIP